MNDMTPIAVPSDWTAEQDLECLEGLLVFEAKDHAEGLRNEMILYCSGLVEMIDAALAYFYQQDLTLFPFPPECLSVTEKLDILEFMVSASAREPAYHDRLNEDIAQCRWAEAERARVFAEHHKCRGKSWLYPLVKVIDLCVVAAFDLEESMVCEHEEFVSPPCWLTYRID